MKYILVVFLFFSINLFSSEVDSLKMSLENASEEDKPEILNNLASYYQNIDWQNSGKFAKKAIDLAIKYNKKEQKVRAYNLLGKVYIATSQYDSAKVIIDSAYFLAKQDYPEYIVEVLLNKGLLNELLNKFDEALIQYNEALECCDESNDFNSRARVLNSLGIVNKQLQDYDKALSYFNDALDIKVAEADRSGIAFIKNNIGIIYDLLGDKDGALTYYREALRINRAMGESVAIGYLEHNIGVILKSTGKVDESLPYFRRSLEQAFIYKDAQSKAYNLHHLADAYFMTGNIAKAFDYANKSLDVSMENRFSSSTYETYRLFSQMYAQQGNSKKALNFYKKYSQLKDSVFNREMQERIAELQARFENEKKEKRIALLENEKRLVDVERSKDQLKIRFRGYISIGLAVVLLVVLVLLRSISKKSYRNKLISEELRIKNAEITQQKEEISSQRDNLKNLNTVLENQQEEILTQNNQLQLQRNLANKQRDEIVEHKVALVDNIKYARRIQQAIFHSKELIGNSFSEYFVINIPQNIVGGDFYWIHKHNDTTILAVADCTGHGVTGGFMSILGISLLNDIVLKDGIFQVEIILNELRSRLVSLLHQNNGNVGNTDGMDIAICSFNHGKSMVEFAGANNSLIVHNRVRDEESEFEGDKMPIGLHESNKIPFKKQSLRYNSEDIFYFFTDGFQDQFGGPDDKKYLNRNFRKILNEIHKKPLNIQRDLLLENFYQWKGDRNQTDDVMIVAVKP